MSFNYNINEQDIDNEYYDNYMLNDTVYTWDITDKQKRCLDMAIYLVDNKCSIRKVAREFGLCKTQVHWWFSKRLKGLSYELYKCVVKQLKLNKKKYFK